MSEGDFGHGGVVYPLADETSVSLLELADPALAAALSFLPAVLDLQLGASLREYAAKDGIAISAAVLTSANVEPVPALYVDRTRFPFFALYRKSETHTGHTATWDKSVSEWEFAYVLPGLMPEPQKRIVPILRAVSRVVGKAVRLGWHPGYQSGRNVWQDAGVMSARLVSARYERYERLDAEQQFFRAVVGTIEVVERDMPVAGAFEDFTGADVSIDETTEDGALADVVALATHLAPTVTLVTPSSGTKAGGQTVTVTGTLFASGATPQVFMGGIECPSVTRISDTELSCVTPAHGAYPTLIADVVVQTADGQTGTLSAGYTFTTP